MVRSVVLIPLLLLLGCGASTPTPPAPVDTSTPPASAAAPTASAGRTPDPDFAADTNALYRIELAEAACPGLTVRREVPQTERLAYLDDVLDCFVEAHRDPLAAHGMNVTKPRLVEAGHDEIVFCPEAGPGDWAAHYCAVTRTITYRPDPAGFSLDPSADVFLLAHEFAHHLQAVSGIWVDASLRHGMGRAPEATPKLELQAMCISAALAGRTPVALSEAALAREIRGLGSWGGHWVITHGTPEQRADWAERGRSGGAEAYAGCNTWAT